jgi:membrane protein
MSSTSVEGQIVQRRRRRVRSPWQLPPREYASAVRRAIVETIADNLPDAAAALAYYGFLAVPSALLVALGLFGLVTDPRDVDGVLAHLRGAVPPEAITLLQGSLQRVTRNSGSSATTLVVGLLLALWTLTGAMTALMRALNTAHERTESRSFVRIRLTALAMLALALVAVTLVAGLLVFGAPISRWLGGRVGQPGLVSTLWWTAQWPILLAGLLVTFAALLYLGPNVEHRRFRPLTFGAVAAVVAWLAVSAGFGLYVAHLGSYARTWGSLAAVIVLLTWLWLSSLVLLVGAELDLEIDRHVGDLVGRDAAALAAPAAPETRSPAAPVRHGTGAGFAAGAVVGAVLAASVLRGRRAG